jgi:hypothetical protein
MPAWLQLARYACSHPALPDANAIRFVRAWAMNGSLRAYSDRLATILLMLIVVLVTAGNLAG